MEKFWNSKVMGGAEERRQSATPGGEGTVSRLMRSRSCWRGVPRWEVPVSRTARQVPCLQRGNSSDPMPMARIPTCQWPSSGMATRSQTSGPAKRRAFRPPMAISLPWPSSVPARKTPNCGTRGLLLFANCWKKLKSGPSVRPLRPSPKSPSKRKDRKGCSDISTATTTFTVLQGGLSPTSESVSLPRRLRSTADPKQTCSRTNWPFRVPVPKPIMTSSPSSSSGTGCPSELTARPVVDLARS
mmetsp:Transcript_30383/g.87029  ORF Transcript_30383/g.87029 Transcript_30383/m.87029 type:complete len:243 (-) Transcript_30383:333-1061(-)